MNIRNASRTPLLLLILILAAGTATRAQDGSDAPMASPNQPADTDKQAVPHSFLKNFPLERPPIKIIEPALPDEDDPYGIEFDTPQPPQPTPPDHDLGFDSLIQPQQTGCTAMRIAFDARYQERVNLFSARKTLKEKDYFSTPYVVKGAKTPMLADILFDFTLVINEDDLMRIVQSFKEQTAGYSATGAWTAQDVRRAIDEKAAFDVCLPIPAYAQDPKPVYKFLMNKAELLLHLFQVFDGKDIKLATFATTKGGVNIDATSDTARGFPTPSGKFWVKRIVYAPSYIHPDWSSSAGKTDAPGFFNPYGIVMAELWKTADPLCTADKDKCDGYNWTYAGGTGIRFHTSNRDSNVRNSRGQPRPSHGCNRLFTKDGKRIFTLLYYKIPHAPCKAVTRGTVCPFLDTVIPYQIVEK